MNATPTRPTHQTHGLVHPLPDGPLDFVADIHGEIDALLELLERLGYQTDGQHPDGRRLVFLGDLVDRGPDSPGVVRLVRGMIQAGNAQAVLGNHELNILRGALKKNNQWILAPDEAVNEAPLDPSEREEFLAFFTSLPLALEREDIRAVHAAWDDAMIEQARAARDAVTLYRNVRESIAAELTACGVNDEMEQNLAHQNRNPVKLITSGPEIPAPKPFELEDRTHAEDRHAWWRDYQGEPFVVFGHYWRKPIAMKSAFLTKRLFGDTPLYDLLGPNTISIDYSVGARASERLNGKTRDFDGELAAMRWPERELVFDHGKIIPLTTSQPALKGGNA